MLKGKFSYTPPAALTGSLRDYRRARGADLQARIEGFAKWRGLRRQHGLWPFAWTRTAQPGAATAAQDAGGEPVVGLNFANQDHLGLAAHPAVLAAAQAAVAAFGLHSAGAASGLGSSPLSAELEQRLADVLGAPDAALFPSGWAAAYGAVKTLVRTTDHVLLDAFAPLGLREGAAAATRNIYLFRHNRVEECRRWLERIRAKDAEGGVVVAVEGLSAAEADIADVAALQKLCHEFEAVLVVHLAHDLGAFGAEGCGVLGEQGMLGKVDVITGSFARTFGTNGGFVACRSSEMTDYVRASSSAWGQSGTLSPAQAAVALKAFDIISDAEGEALRSRLAANAASLRQQLAEAGLEVMGVPAPVVCVRLGSEGLARLVVRRLAQAGVIAELVEFPAAPKDQARLRLHMSALHEAAQIREAASAIGAAWAAGREEFDWLNSEREKLRASA